VIRLPRLASFPLLGPCLSAWPLPRVTHQKVIVNTPSFYYLSCSTLSKTTPLLMRPSLSSNLGGIERRRISGLISKPIDINRRHLVSVDSILLAAAPPIKAASLVGGFAPVISLAVCVASHGRAPVTHLDQGFRESIHRSSLCPWPLSAPEKQSVQGRVHLTFQYRSYGS
jgi:hypothetical protein